MQEEVSYFMDINHILLSKNSHSNCTLDLCRPLRGFDLVKDKDTGNSKGYGFCIYQVNDQALGLVLACAAPNFYIMFILVLTD